MPKLRRPDGRVVSVSKTGVPYLLQRGYSELGAGPAPSLAKPVDLEAMDFSELRAHAESIGVEIPGNVKKPETVRARIAEHLEAAG